MRWCRHLAVFSLFALVTLIITQPLPLRMSHSLGGESVDTYLNPWVDWWTRHVLTTPGESLYHTDYLFYPDGVSLVYHSFSHTNTAISLVLQPWLGQPAAYNVTILLAYLLSAFGMYVLVVYLTGSIIGGILAGIVFAFNPYHIFESTHPVLVSTQWMPFVVLYLLRWLRDRKWWHLTLAAFFFLVNALTSWHLMTFLCLWLAMFSGYYLAFEDRLSFTRRLGGLVAFALLAGLLVLPFLWPLMSEGVTWSLSYMPADLDKGRGIDLEHLMMPPWIKPAVT